MVISRSHIPWAIFVLVASLLAGVLYMANYHPGVLPGIHGLPAMFGPTPPLRRTFGGTPLGLIFGSVSLLIFLIAAGLGIRKKKRLWPIGHVQRWMRAHIWLTTLTIPLIFLHCGFHFGGQMTSWLMALYGVVMISGYYGLAMQQFIPRLMTQALPQEVVYEQIPYIRRVLVEQADRLWAELAPSEIKAEFAVAGAETGHGSGGALSESEIQAAADDEASRRTISEFLHDVCQPYLQARDARRMHLHNAGIAEEIFRMLKLSVTPEWRDKAEQMQRWCSDRRLLDKQTRLHHWLHWWLLVHVPLSLALLIITFWHAYVTVIYL